jgi:hypothetical protein
MVGIFLALFSLSASKQWKLAQIAARNTTEKVQTG